MIDFFSKKYLTSIWNSIWQDWVFSILGQIQILWKYLVFEVKYKYLKVFGIPNKLKVFNPPLDWRATLSQKNTVHLMLIPESKPRIASVPWGLNGRSSKPYMSHLPCIWSLAEPALFWTTWQRVECRGLQRESHLDKGADWSNVPCCLSYGVWKQPKAWLPFRFFKSQKAFNKMAKNPQLAESWVFKEFCIVCRLFMDVRSKI